MVTLYVVSLIACAVAAASIMIAVHYYRAKHIGIARVHQDMADALFEKAQEAKWARIVMAKKAAEQLQATRKVQLEEMLNASTESDLDYLRARLGAADQSITAHQVDPDIDKPE